jgi:hypothetical protein
MKIKSRFWILFIIGILIVSSPISAKAGESTLLAITKRIVLEAAKIGIDEAGNFVLGPVWRLLKRVVKPVYDELQERYPNLGLKGTPAAEAAAQEAVRDLSHDKRLEEMLNDGFKNLQEGQAAIMAELNRMNRVFNTHGKTLESIQHVQERILDELNRDRQRTQTTELKEYSLLTEFEETANKNNTPPDLRALFKLGLLRSLHTKEVLENGKPHTYYTYVSTGVLVDANQNSISFLRRPTMYYIYTSGSFQDFGYVNCRDVTETYLGTDGNRYPTKYIEGFPYNITGVVTGKPTYCRIRGEWKQMGLR